MPADQPATHPHDADPGARFTYVGGRLAIDLINTVENWHGPEHLERYDNDKLVAYTDLVDWAETAGAVTPDHAETLREAAAERPAEAAAVLDRARAFRLALHDVLAAKLAGAPPDATDVAIVNTEVATQLAESTLVWVPDGFHLDRSGSRGPCLDRPLWPVARSVVDLLTDPTDLGKVRTCAADTCGWMFLDTSGGRRRWCSMADCGNNEKVRRFRKRQRGAAAARR